jgi:hypothetical protein
MMFSAVNDKRVTSAGLNEKPRLSKFNGYVDRLLLAYRGGNLPMQTVDMRILYHAENLTTSTKHA